MSGTDIHRAAVCCVGVCLSGDLSLKHVPEFTYMAYL